MEAIATRPRNLDLYLTNRLKTLSTIRTRLAQAKDLIAQNRDAGSSTFNYCLRYGAPDDQKDMARETGYRLEYLDLENYYELEALQRNLESYQQYRADANYDFLKYVFSTLDHIRPPTPEDRTALSLLPYAETGFAEYGYAEDDDDPEYQAAKHLLTAYRTIAICLTQIETLQQDIKTKLGAIRDLKANAYNIERYKPVHGDTETLYHATAYVTEIVRDGFQAEPPDGRRGLGNYGHQNDISFTHDLEIARNIMRTLKDMWMIAHGQLTGNTILKWAQAEGIADGVRKSWQSLTGGALPMRDAKPEDVAYLYRYWMSHSKLRDDPMMTYPDAVIAMLKDRTLRDIGVLACGVRLDAEDRYLYAESEFRLPPDRVLSIKQIM